MCGRVGVSIGPTNHPSAQPLARANTRSHFTTGFYNRRWLWPPIPSQLGFRLHEDWLQSIIYPLVDNGWIMEHYDCCKNPVVKTKVRMFGSKFGFQ